jgi:uncharacterized DUF497 family protein
MSLDSSRNHIGPTSDGFRHSLTGFPCILNTFLAKWERLLYIQKSYILRLVLDGLKGFDWDLHNVGHVARHGISPAEVEEAVARPHAIIPARDMAGEKRWKLFGTSAAGRCLPVVFTIRDERLRPVTAHPMNQPERRTYGPEINSTQ